MMRIAPILIRTTQNYQLLCFLMVLLGMQNSILIDLDLFFLYSYQWVKQGRGEYRLFQDLFKRGLLGRAHEATDLGFVYNSHHSEFSDTRCMKVPLWMVRAVKMTGVRNPHETAEAIMTRTSSFIAEVRQQGAPK